MTITINGSGTITGATTLATTTVNQVFTTPVVTTTIGVGGATPSGSGSGITFPATQSASSDANTLDDYEEGTWTPTDGSGAGLTFTAGLGSYTKIGRMVYWQAVIIYPTTASSSVASFIGLPFPINGLSTQGRAGSTITATSVTTLIQSLQVETVNSVRFYKAGLVQATNIELSGATIYASGFYSI
jgi:hypothetical protein